MALVSEELAACTVLDEEERGIRLGDLWGNRPVVLLFVRHFGCVFCKELVGRAAGIAGRVAALGVDLVVIGNGSPRSIPAFREGTGWSGPLYSDPELEAYRAAGMKHGLFAGFKLVSNAVRAFRAGLKQGKVDGDPFQQGGAILVTPAGEVAYAYISATGGDHPPLDELLAACEKLPFRRAG
jgi:peroxiredoxin